MAKRCIDLRVLLGRKVPRYSDVCVFCLTEETPCRILGCSHAACINCLPANTICACNTPITESKFPEVTETVKPQEFIRALVKHLPATLTATHSLGLRVSSPGLYAELDEQMNLVVRDKLKTRLETKIADLRGYKVVCVGGLRLFAYNAAQQIVHHLTDPVLSVAHPQAIAAPAREPSAPELVIKNWNGSRGPIGPRTKNGSSDPVKKGWDRDDYKKSGAISKVWSVDTFWFPVECEEERFIYYIDEERQTYINRVSDHFGGFVRLQEDPHYVNNTAIVLLEHSAVVTVHPACVSVKVQDFNHRLDFYNHKNIEAHLKLVELFITRGKHRFLDALGEALSGLPIEKIGVLDWIIDHKVLLTVGNVVKASVYKGSSLLWAQEISEAKEGALDIKCAIRHLEEDPSGKSLASLNNLD